MFRPIAWRPFAAMLMVATTAGCGMGNQMVVEPASKSTTHDAKLKVEIVKRGDLILLTMPLPNEPGVLYAGAGGLIFSLTTRSSGCVAMQRGPHKEGPVILWPSGTIIDESGSIVLPSGFQTRTFRIGQRMSGGVRADWRASELGLRESAKDVCPSRRYYQVDDRFAIW